MFTLFLGDREQGQTLRQLVFAMNVGCPGEMTAVNRGMTAKVMEVNTEGAQKMIGTATSDMVQGVQNEMDTCITMMIEVGSQGMINTGNHEGSGDGRDRDRGQWMQGMAEMRSDVEWDDTPLAIFHPRYPLASLFTFVVRSVLIKPGLVLRVLEF